jgi:ubiquinone/menaquinone biosynthesis C-methylase UbiE
MDGDDVADDRDPRRVREVYDEIAAHFSKTREYAWPEVEAFLDAQPPAGRGVDIGCGNGRHLEQLSRKTTAAVGVDISHNLLREAQTRRGRENWTGALIQGDATTLPLTSNAVDIAVYVATIHHLPDRPARRESLAELARVLRDGGQALVSAWSTTHDRFDERAEADVGFDTTVDWTLPGGETVPRFYHIYTPAEFEADLEASPLTMVDSYVASGNCYGEVTVADEGKRP